MSNEAERLWTEVVTRAFVMELVEMVAPIFIGRTVEGSVQTRYISVQDVDFQGKKINDVIHIELTAKILSDQGQWLQPMIVRIHKFPDRFSSEIRLYDVLCDRAAKFDDIHPTKLLHSDPQKLLIVYESIASDPILNLDPLLIDFSLGRIASVLHGYDVNNFRLDDLINSIKYILEYMPFQNDIKTSIQQFLERKAQMVPYTQSGFIPCTAFTPSLLKIKYKVDNPASVDLFMVANGKAFDTYIPMGVVDEDFHDRYEDVANFYAIDAFEEYLRTGSINETKERIERFLTGYNMISYRTFGLEFKSLYPVGHTLDLQLLLSIWLKEVASFDQNNPDLQRIRNLGHFSIYILSEGILDDLEIDTF
ncbi:MAG: hypothetical protein D6732_15980 [Methanobacteriota archaeon]|nr:MAG: hypothetical protein D6732_15980 [Euryarchaeota archaeon]